MMSIGIRILFLYNKNFRRDAQHPYVSHLTMQAAKKFLEKAAQLANHQYQSPFGLSIRAVRHWPPEIRYLLRYSSYSWPEKSISLLTHGVRQSTMSWDSRSLTFYILDEEFIKFRNISDRDRYDREANRKTMSKTESDQRRAGLIQSIRQRGGDVYTAGMFYSSSNNINESIVDISGGLNCIKAVAFKTYEDLTDLDSRFTKLDRSLSQNSVCSDSDVALVCNLMDATIAKTLTDKFRSEVPLLLLNNDHDLFSPLTITKEHIIVLKELAQKIQAHPGFQKISQDPTDGYNALFQVFINVAKSFDETTNGHVPRMAMVYYAMHSFRGLFARPNNKSEDVAPPHRLS